MQTWLTRASFLDTAADLETDLLAQTMIDADQACTTMIYGYAPEEGNVADFGPDHPVYAMWVGYEVALAAYAASLAVELALRGVHNATHLALANTIRELRQTDDEADFVMPPWINDTDVLRSHRSNMARRWPDAYGKAWLQTPPRMPYLWPFVDSDGGYELYVSKHDKALLKSGARSLSPNIKKRVVNL